MKCNFDCIFSHQPFSYLLWLPKWVLHGVDKQYALESFLSLFTGSLAPGIPTEKDLISLYCKFRGLRDIHHEHWNFYIALSFFRMAAIAQVMLLELNA